RILPLPVPAANYSHLSPGTAGHVFYLEEPPEPPADATVPIDCKLKRFDLSKRKDEQILPRVARYYLTVDGSKALAFSPPDSWSIISLGTSSAPTKGEKDGKFALEIRINPREEWKQIFDEAWRINRDYFYDPKMHGADWLAIRKKY